MLKPDQKLLDVYKQQFKTERARGISMLIYIRIHANAAVTMDQ